MLTVQQHSIRGYASDAPPKQGMSGLAYGAAAGMGAFGVGYYYMTSQQKHSLQAEGPAPKAFQGGEQGFLSLRLDSVEELSGNTKKFRFALPEPDQESGLPVASAVLSKFQDPGMDKPVLRPYTPTSDTDEKGFVDFVIKQYTNGPMSTHLHEMVPGQRLDIKGPLPKYPMAENKHNHIVMIAGGTGVTPMWQVARSIFKNPNDQTKVTLVFGNVTEDDILLKKEWNELENTYPRRFRAFYTLDKAPKDWVQGKGFITKELLKQIMPEPNEPNIKIFVCGPPGLYQAISGTKNSPSDQGELTGALRDLGYSNDQVYKF
ncbi:MAG: hypothetical protein Q9162_006690 [Coniocarpon cinnabarinum]